MKIESRGFRITDIGVDVDIVSDGHAAWLKIGTTATKSVNVDELTKLRDAITYAIELIGDETTPAEPSRPKRVRDRDGDVWTRRMDGTYSLDGNVFTGEDYDYISCNYGPLTAVEE